MQSYELQSTAKSSIARVTRGHGPLNHRCHVSTTMCAGRVVLHQKASMSLFNRLCSTTIHIIASTIYVMRMRPWFKQAVKHYYSHRYCLEAKVAMICFCACLSGNAIFRSVASLLVIAFG